MTELKPCPFCGSSDITVDLGSREHIGRATCLACSATVYCAASLTDHRIAAVWNSRVGTTDLDAQFDANARWLVGLQPQATDMSPLDLAVAVLTQSSVRNDGARCHQVTMALAGLVKWMKEKPRSPDGWNMTDSGVAYWRTDPKDFQMRWHVSNIRHRTFGTVQGQIVDQGWFWYTCDGSGKFSPMIGPFADANQAIVDCQERGGVAPVGNRP